MVRAMSCTASRLPLVRLVALLLVLWLGPVTGVFAVAVDPPLADPALEARARELHKQLRCLVCQNQSIEDSNAALARDLRVLVRERVAAGDSDAAVLDFVVARYGDWVLLQPPLKGSTVLLWAAPVVLLLAAALGAFFWLRAGGRGAPATAADLSESERRRLDALMKENPPE